MFKIKRSENKRYLFKPFRAGPALGFKPFVGACRAFGVVGATGAVDIVRGRGRATPAATMRHTERGLNKEQGGRKGKRGRKTI